MTEQDPNLKEPVEQEPEETVSLPKAEYETMKADADAKANLVAEIKELREKKQLTEVEKVELEKKLKEIEEQPGEGDELTSEKVAELIQKGISQREAEQATQSRESVLSEFRKTHNEFNEDNDEAGIKFSAFERVLGRFNTEVKSGAEFKRILNDAYTLMIGAQKSDPEPDSPAPDEPNVPNEPTPVDVTELTSQELSIIKDTFDGDKERYLKIKEKRPDYVARLLRSMV